jgi:hypothetical protein
MVDSRVAFTQEDKNQPDSKFSKRSKDLKRAKLFGGICLTLILLVSLCAVPAFADEPESESGLLPPSIMPVIVLQGSDYDMGYQYAQQIAELFDLSLLEDMQSWGGFTDDDILALKAYQWYIKEQTPEVIEIMKGMADGATDAGVELSYTEVLAYYVGGWFGVRSYPGTEPPGSESDTLPPSCTQWAAWGDTTADGNLLCGCSDDWVFGNYVVTVAFPDDGNSYMTMGTPVREMLGMSWACMNNKGVFFSISLGESTLPRTEYPGGYDNSQAGLNQHMLRYCDTAEEARDMLLSYDATGGWNRLIAGTSGDAYVLELISGDCTEVRYPGDFGEDDYIYCTNNYLTDEGGEANLWAGTGYFTEHGGWCLDPPPGEEDPGSTADIQLSSVARNLMLYNMLSNYQGDVDTDFGKMMYRFTGEAPDDPFDILEYRATKAEAWGTICNLNNVQVAVAQPDDGDEGLMYICTGPAGRVSYPFEPGPAEDWYQIAGTHSFYELTLASSASDVVGIAGDVAHHYIAMAYQELMWLNYGDVGFEGLNELFSLANTEYYEGVNWASKARFAGGNEAMLYNAQAATSFTRAQAHAKEIYNALVPPAVTPKDLGLHPYNDGKGKGKDKGKGKGKDK